MICEDPSVMVGLAPELQPGIDWEIEKETLEIAFLIGEHKYR
jgi:hypothetical protein